MKEESNISNWNAGKQFNELIHEWSSTYAYLHLRKAWNEALAQLHIAYDFTYYKMREESDKMKCYEDFKKQDTDIRNFLKNATEEFSKNTSSSKYDQNCRNKLNLLRERIWFMMGKYKVLYPHMEETDFSNVPTASRT